MNRETFLDTLHELQTARELQYQNVAQAQRLAHERDDAIRAFEHKSHQQLCGVTREDTIVPDCGKGLSNCSVWLTWRGNS